MRVEPVIGAELAAACLLILSALVPWLADGGHDGAMVNRWQFEAAPEDGVLEARCAYDLGQGPVRVTVEPWTGGLSVSVRDSAGRGLVTADERGAPEGVDLVLATQGQATPPGSRVVISPSPRGEVLQRRKVQTPERVVVADQARRGDGCGRVGMDFPAVPRR